MVEELRDFFRRAVAALVDGSHPHLGGFLDELFAHSVRPFLHERYGAGVRVGLLDFGR